MGRIIATSGGTFKDLPTFRALVDRGVSIVEADEPDVLAYESFVDEAASRFAWHEIFANGAAILRHVQNFADAGLLEEVPAAMDFDVTIAMGDVDHDGRAVLEKLGFAILAPHAGVVR